MICSKCGENTPENSDFCVKCGERLNNSELHLPHGETYAPSPSTAGSSDDSEFSSFVNKRVREMTDCGSAEELLRKSPMRIPMIICYAPCIFLAIKVAAGMGHWVLSLITFVFISLAGMLGSMLIGFICHSRYISEQEHKLTGELKNVDPNVLLWFLNSKLAYLKPLTGDWGYFSQARLAGKGERQLMDALPDFLVDIAGELAEQIKEKNICLGSKCGKLIYAFSIVQLNFSPNEPDVVKYSVTSGITIKQSITMSVYNCLYRTAPIVSAAMEYFRDHQQSITEQYNANTVTAEDTACINSVQSFFAKNLETIAVVLAVIIAIVLLA